MPHVEDMGSCEVTVAPGGRPDRAASPRLRTGRVRHGVDGAAPPRPADRREAPAGAADPSPSDASGRDPPASIGADVVVGDARHHGDDQRVAVDHDRVVRLPVGDHHGVPGRVPCASGAGRVRVPRDRLGDLVAVAGGWRLRRTPRRRATALGQDVDPRSDSSCTQRALASRCRRSSRKPSRMFGRVGSTSRPSPVLGRRASSCPEGESR